MSSMSLGTGPLGTHDDANRMNGKTDRAPPPARGRIRNRGWCVPRIPNRACRQRRCVEQVFGTAGGAAHSPDRKWYRIDPAPSQPRGAVTSEGDVAAASGEGATKRVAPEERAIAGSRDEHCRRACALSPVTRHPSPVTRHPSPGARARARARRYSIESCPRSFIPSCCAPVRSTPRSVARQPTPVPRPRPQTPDSPQAWRWPESATRPCRSTLELVAIEPSWSSHVDRAKQRSCHAAATACNEKNPQRSRVQFSQ